VHACHAELEIALSLADFKEGEAVKDITTEPLSRAL
jgi:hypothetical protein